MASFLLPGWLIGAFLGRVLPFTIFMHALSRYGCSPFKNAISTSNILWASSFIMIFMESEQECKHSKENSKFHPRNYFADFPCSFFFLIYFGALSPPWHLFSLTDLYNHWRSGQWVYLGANILWMCMNQKGKAFSTASGLQVTDVSVQGHVLLKG